MKKKAVAIITARGGSKRIPKKNIKDFMGKPILSYSIEAALQSGLFDEVMVSTDSQEIAAVAEEYGANVPFLRSPLTSDDYATTADVLLEVLEEYRKRGQEFEYMACIYPTAPFVTAEKLRNAFAELEKTGEAMLLPVVSFSYPPQRGYRIQDQRLEMKWKENLNRRSQDLEPLYHDCGQFYLYRAEAFLEKKGQFAEGIVPFLLSDLEVQDIDNETDWKLAELKYQMMQQ
ncbi:MAG: pseudaminic acid cytidylyltransferase [Clostridiaceae bacterium]|nr:pseudaminic acid cytidylyltransferase [Clostridiaceae bacterium]